MNTHGQINQPIKVISFRDIEMVTEHGGTVVQEVSLIKDIICWIKSTGTECMTGEISIFTRDIFSKTSGAVKDSSFIKINSFMMVFGSTGSAAEKKNTVKKVKTSPQNLQKKKASRRISTNIITLRSTW